MPFHNLMTDSPPMSAETPLGVVIGRLAKAAPDRPAVTCGQVTRSRAELEARTNRLARAYGDLGVTPNSFVGDWVMWRDILARKIKF